jgi:hypothetical protein
MASHHTSFILTYRHARLPENKITGLGIQVTYEDRLCVLSIELAQAEDGSQPENEFALAELRRLRGALNDILDD